MDERLVAEVWRRAGHTCEYCHMPYNVDAAPFEVDHIIARQHGGLTVLGNLALSCFHCNSHKGPNIAGIDRVTSRTKPVPLFNPRRHKWEKHFRWADAHLKGVTPIGRVTIAVLAINDLDQVDVRQALIMEGAFL